MKLHALSIATTLALLGMLPLANAARINADQYAIKGSHGSGAGALRKQVGKGSTQRGQPLGGASLVTASAAAHSSTSYALRHPGLWFSRNFPGVFTHGAAYADFNRDGLTDVFVASGTGQNVRTPVKVMLNTGSGFVDATAQVLRSTSAGLIHARKAITGDYNNDGWPDVYVMGHGYDQPPFIGEYNQLFLSNGDGTLSYDPALESIVSFGHGGASADIDGNGTLDILAIAAPSYLLINDGLGHFTYDTSRMPPDMTSGYYTGELVDIDQDGYVDLVAGGHDFDGATARIYWGAAGGSFATAQKTVLPVVAGFGVVMDFAVADIDADGNRDLVLARTGSPPAFYQGRHLQILRRTSARTFADETSRIQFNGALGWFDFLRVQDFNGDGCPDIFLDDRSRAGSGEHAWRNDCTGSFQPYSGRIVPQTALVHAASADFDGDGRSDVLWRDTGLFARVTWWAAADANRSTPKSRNAFLGKVSNQSVAWSVAGIGDLDGDGGSDVVWRNELTGQAEIWRRASPLSRKILAAPGDPAWRIVGVADFDGDGADDLLWRHQGIGANMMWPGGDASASQVMAPVAGWTVAGVADATGDGKADILWRDLARAMRLWRSEDATTVQIAAPTGLWRVVGFADFDGNGVADMLWRDFDSGANMVWPDGNAANSRSAPGMGSLAWRVSGLGDYDGDGLRDVLWHNDDTGANLIWRSADPTLAQPVADRPGLAWSPRS